MVLELEEQVGAWRVPQRARLDHDAQQCVPIARGLASRRCPESGGPQHDLRRVQRTKALTNAFIDEPATDGGAFQLMPPISPIVCMVL